MMKQVLVLPSSNLFFKMISPAVVLKPGFSCVALLGGGILLGSEKYWERKARLQ